MRRYLAGAHRPVKARHLSAAMTCDLRNRCAAAARAGPAAVDVVRAEAPFPATRARYWNILRHRMAPEVETRIDALRTAGRLGIVAGLIVRAEHGKDGIAVKILRRGRNQSEDRKFA